MTTDEPKKATKSFDWGLFVFGSGSLAGLHQEAGLLRLVALVDFSLMVVILVVLQLFFGFDDLIEQLFFMSTLHLLIAPIILIASYKQGLALYVAVVLASLGLILDSIQLVVRLYIARFTLEWIVYFLLNLAFAVASVIYVAVLVRVFLILRKRKPIAFTEERKALLLSQESNIIRVAGFFSTGASLLILLFGLFIALIVRAEDELDTATETLLLMVFGAGHFFVGPYAITLGHQRFVLVAILFVAAIILLLLDGTHVVLRLRNVEFLPLNQIVFIASVNIFFLLILVLLIVIDAVYLTSGLTYLYLDSRSAVAQPREPADLESHSSDDNSTDVERTTEEGDADRVQAAGESESEPLDAMVLRRRIPATTTVAATT